MSEPTLSQIFQARLHLMLAQSHLPGPLRRTNDTLTAWLNALTVGPAFVIDASDAPRFDFEAAVTADFQRLTWRAAGPPTRMADAMRQFFAQAGIDDHATNALEPLTAQFQPATLGAWVEAQGDEVDTGWYIPSRVALASALKWALTVAPTSQTPHKLADWATACGAESCVRMARSVAEGNPFTELRIELPGENVDAWVLAGVRLFAALGIADLPDDALGALLNANTEQMVASIWFTPRGVVKTGIMVAAPELDLTLDFFRMATDAQRAADFSPLAELQGNLQVEGPTWAEAQQRASGFGVEYHYTLPI